MCLEHTLSEGYQNYLKAIYILGDRQEYVRAIDLSRLLDVSKPSVSKMLKRLEGDELVLVNEKNHILLTSHGKEHAKEVYESHSLIEHYLHDILGIDHQTAHEDACKLEHKLSNDTLLKLEEHYNAMIQRKISV